MNISGKVKEAETYYAMGLFEESLSVYEKILYKMDEPDLSTKDSIHKKINEIKTEIETSDQDNTNDVSSEEIAFFKKALLISEDLTDRIQSASVFKESGLYKEAIAEYDKLLCENTSLDNIIPDLAICLLNGYMSSEVLDRAKEIIRIKEFEDQYKAEITYRLGMEIEKNGEMELSYEFYQSANQLDPDNEDIKNNLVKVFSGLSIPPNDTEFDSTPDVMLEDDTEDSNGRTEDKDDEKLSFQFIQPDDNNIKIINEKVLKKKEREFFGAIKAGLDWGIIQNIFIEEYRESISDFVNCQQGDFVVYNDSVAYKLDFEINMPFSLMIGRQGHYLEIAPSN